MDIDRFNFDESYVLSNDFLIALKPSVNYLEDQLMDIYNLRGIPLNLLSIINNKTKQDIHIYKRLNFEYACKDIILQYCLFSAVRNEKINIAEEILDLGVDPNFYFLNRSILSNLIVYHEYVNRFDYIKFNLFKKLIQKGADIHARDSIGNSIIGNSWSYMNKEACLYLFDRMESDHPDIIEILQHMQDHKYDEEIKKRLWFIDMIESEKSRRDELKSYFKLIPHLSLPPEWSLPIFTTAFKMTEGYVLGYQKKTEFKMI